jgi:hypothetical protein
MRVHCYVAIHLSIEDIKLALNEWEPVHACQTPSRATQRF